MSCHASNAATTGAVDVIVWEVFVVDDHVGVLVEVEIGQVNPVATDVVGGVETRPLGSLLRAEKSWKYLLNRDNGHSPARESAVPVHRSQKKSPH